MGTVGRWEMGRGLANGLGGEWLLHMRGDILLIFSEDDSKRAREERALAAERRIRALQAQSQGTVAFPLMNFPSPLIPWL